MQLSPETNETEELMRFKLQILKLALATLIAITIDASLNASEAYASEPSTVTKTQTFMESEGAQSIEWPETIEDEQGTWKLVEVDEPIVDPAWIRPSEIKSITKTLTVEAARAQAADSLFENTIDYDASGWKGTLTKAGVSLTPEYEVHSRQVDKLVTLEGLETNDVTQIPQTKEFTVSTAESVDSTGTAALALSDVAWLVTKTNEQGVPSEYSASCNYRGVEEFLTIPAYTLTCTWTGEAIQTDTQMISTATYELDKSFPWQLVIAAVLVSGCASIVVYVRTRTPNRSVTPKEA